MDFFNQLMSGNGATKKINNDNDFFNHIYSNTQFKEQVPYKPKVEAKPIVVDKYKDAKNEKGEPISYEYQVEKQKKLRSEGKALFKNRTDAEIEKNAKYIYEQDKKSYDIHQRGKENTGDTSYEGFLKIQGYEDNAASKIIYALETPYRLKGISNIFGTVSDNMGAGRNYGAANNIYKDQRLTGNTVIDGATNLLGQGASMFTAVPGTNINPINVADDFAGNIANKVTNKLGNGTASKIANSAVKGAVSGAVDNTIDNVKLAGQDEGLGESLLNGAIGGGLLFGAGRGLKEGGSKILDNVFNKKFDPGYNINFDGLDNIEADKIKMPPREFRSAKMVNKDLENIYKQYDNAVSDVQNVTGHYKLTDDEMLNAMDNTNNDIFSLLDRMSEAENQRFNPNKIGQRARLRRIAGLSEAPDNITPINVDNVINKNKPELQNVKVKETPLYKDKEVENIMGLKRPEGLTPKGMFSKNTVETPRVTIKKDRSNTDLGVYNNKGIDYRNVENLKSITKSSKTNAISWDYPDLQDDLQNAAEGIKNELKMGTKGESGNVYEDGNWVGNWKVQQNQSETVHQMLNSNMTYEDIQKGADDIIKDHGRENSTEAKKVELFLDKDLTEGATTLEGYKMPPNQDYIEKKKLIAQAEKDISTPRFDNKIVFDGNDKTTSSIRIGKDKLDFWNKKDYVPAKEQVGTLREVIKNPNPKIEKVAEPPKRVIALEKNNNGRIDGERQPRIERQASNNDNLDIKLEESKQKTNTWRNADFMQSEKVQDIADDINAYYEVKPNVESFNKANADLKNNYDEVINRIKKEGITNAEDSVASGIITNDLIRQAKETGDYSKVKEWLEIVRPKVTDIAQALQAFSTWKDMSPEGTLLKAQRVVDSAKDKMLKNKKLKNKIEAEIKKTPELETEILDKFKIPRLTEEDTKLISEAMEKINDMPDGRPKDIEFAKIKKLMADKTVPTFADKFKAAQRISMLLNTKTMTRNIVGNVVMGGLENTKDVIGTGIDKVISKKTGNRTTSTPSVKTQYKAGKEGFLNTIDDHKKGIDTSKSTGQYDLPNTKAFNSGPLSKLEDLTSTGLKLGDNPFYEAAYEDTARQLKELYGVDELTEEMKELADTVAKDRTFQNDSNMSTGLKKIQNGLNLGKDVGLGTVALPFVKTPANILDKAIDYSPGGLYRGIKGLYKNGGDLTLAEQKKIVDQLSRGITGTGLIGAGYLGAESGLLTGSGPDDREAADLEKQAGKLPYSLKIGDTYNTIDNLQPAAIPLMVGADINKAIKNDKSKGGALEKGVVAGVSTLFDQSLLTGLSKLFGGYENSPGENIVSGIKNTALGVPGQLYPSALKQAAQLVDTTQRDTSSENPIGREINKIISKTPFLSKTLPARVDTLGNEKGNFNDSEGLKYLYDVLFNPGMSDKYDPSRAEKFALDLYNNSGETVHMPRYANNSITYKGTNGKKETVQLTNEEKMMLQKYIGDRTNNAYSSKNVSGNPGEQARKLQSLLSEIYKDGENMILRKKGLPTKK